MHGPCKRCCVDIANRRCAFVTGVFSPDHVSCGTVDELREKADDHGAVVWGEYDQNLRVINWANEFVVLSQYKHRTTKTAYVIDDRGGARRLSLEDAEECLDYVNGAGRYAPVPCNVEVVTLVSAPFKPGRSPF